MIVVTMTSWTKRINNVKPVVESVMNNTMKPDRVYLNLSEEEFKGKENDLPKDLVEYFHSDERLIINWVGKNTKTMKKVFPILQYLNDEDFIINIDDDALIPDGFIKKRYEELLQKNGPITSCNNPKYHFINKDLKIWSCGAGSIFKKKMLNGYEMFMDDKLTYSYNDDWCYATLLWLNGYKFIPCDSYSMQNGSIDNNNTKLKKYNDIEPMGKKHEYVDHSDMYTLLNNRIKNIFGVSFENAYKILNNKYKHDCVLVYGRTGVDSVAMTCGEHLEIEYVIASLKKFCSSWCGRIFVVGTEPPKEIKNDVIHIPCDNPYTHCKDANIIHKLRYACENITDLSDDFLMISDDQIVTKESSWEDMKPRICRKYSDWNEERWVRNKKIDKWNEYLYDTLNLFPKETSAFWEPHIWSPMNKYKFVEMCKKYDYQHSVACISQSLYYNFINQQIVKNFEHIHLSDSKSITILKSLNTKNIERHLSWADKAFGQKKFRDILDEIVGFKTNIKNTKPVINQEERNKKIDDKLKKIQQLREDIQKGNVIKVPVGNGKFIWKRVK